MPKPIVIDGAHAAFFNEFVAYKWPVRLLAIPLEPPPDRVINAHRDFRVVVASQVLVAARDQVLDSRMHNMDTSVNLISMLLYIFM